MELLFSNCKFFIDNSYTFEDASTLSLWENLASLNSLIPFEDNSFSKTSEFFRLNLFTFLKVYLLCYFGWIQFQLCHTFELLNNPFRNHYDKVQFYKTWQNLHNSFLSGDSWKKSAANYFAKIFFEVKSEKILG